MMRGFCLRVIADQPPAPRPKKERRKEPGQIGYADPGATPSELAHLYEGETDPLYQWPNPPRGELPW